MRKKREKGFVLIETLVVTTVVAGILIFLFIQFSNLSKSYDESYAYNTTEGLYALEDVKQYISTDSNLLQYIEYNIEFDRYIDITDCSLFAHYNYCENLLELENIDKIFISKNKIPKDYITEYDEKFMNFINKINPEGIQKYRLVASFKDNTYATVRFGDIDE